MAVNDFVVRLHDGETELAERFKDERGIDWAKYILEKEKAGFGKFDQWYFIDRQHITVQVQSKYKYQWEYGVGNVTYNSRLAIANVLIVHNEKPDFDGYQVIKDLARERKEDRVLWTNEIMQPYNAVGYGVNFSANTRHDNNRHELLDILYEKANIKIRALTVFWLEHDKMVIILHDDAEFA